MNYTSKIWNYELKFSVMIFSILLFSLQVLFAQSLSFQGILRDPLLRTVENGQFTLTVKLYDVEVGGTQLWSEIHEDVSIHHGVFYIELGETNSFDDISFDTQYFLGVTVEDAAEIFPRFKLNTVASSLSIVGKDNVFPSTGNVGIGTLQPTAKLEISSDGASKVSVNNSGGNKSGIAFGDENQQWEVNNSSSDNHLNIENNTSEQVLTISPNGQVGIAMTAPSSALHLGGEADDLLLSVSGNIKMASDKGIHISSDKYLGSDGENFVLLNNGNTGLTVLPDGKVGIANASPNEALDVNGDIKLSDGGSILFSDGTALATSSIGASSNFLTNDSDALIIADDDNDGTGDIQLMVGSETKMTISNNGNVGLGSDDPNHNLVINGDINFTGELLKNGSPFVATPWQEDASNLWVNTNIAIDGSNNNEYNVNIGGVINANDFRQSGFSILNKGWATIYEFGDLNGDPYKTFLYGGKYMITPHSSAYDESWFGGFDLIIRGNNYGYSTIEGAAQNEKVSIGRLGDNYSYFYGADGTFLQMASTDYPVQNFYGYELRYYTTYTFSDRRVKRNIEAVSQALGQLRQIEGVKYDINLETHPSFKGRQVTSSETTSDIYGFIAQNVMESIPEMVEFHEDYQFFNMRNSHQIFALYVEALKELKAKNDVLKARVKQAGIELENLNAKR